MRKQVQKNIQTNKSTGTYIPELISRFLKTKGFLNQEDQLEFLNPSMKDIKSPFTLNGMDEACVRLFKAYKNNETLGIYCDYDLDGSSAAAILFHGLGQLGFNNIQIYQPRRLVEGYGFHKVGVDVLKAKGVSLIITVDVGITAHETCLYAKKKSVDVILTDHHLPDATLPQALTIINPNTKECRAGLGHLCGAGVAFYLVYGFVKYLKNLHEEIKSGFSLESLLDLFVIGTLTDMVPLVKENRVLVKRGLKRFSNTIRPGLQALKARCELVGKQMSSSDIGFKIAPKLNSLSRLDTELRPTAILIEENKQTAEKLVSEAFLVNEKRVQSLEKDLKKAMDYFRKYPPKKLCFFISKDIHPGVRGLIATRLVEEYGVPAFIGNILKNGQIIGSARLPGKTGLSLKEMMSFCPSLIQFGGHAEAAGFELELKKAPQFKNELNMYLEDFFTKEANIAFGVKYDCEVYLGELNQSFLNWLKHLEPFGVDFEQPIFKISDLEIVLVRKLKDKHYKLLVSDKKGKTFDVLWFSPQKDHEVALMIESQNYISYKFNFYVNPNINFFRNIETLQLLMSEVEVSSGLHFGREI